jgi:hypothetical protein
LTFMYFLGLDDACTHFDVTQFSWNRSFFFFGIENESFKRLNTLTNSRTREN